MAKKKVELEQSEISSGITFEQKINKIDLDFGRTDLNLLRDTLNQLIEKNG